MLPVYSRAPDAGTVGTQCHRGVTGTIHSGPEGWMRKTEPITELGFSVRRGLTANPALPLSGGMKGGPERLSRV